ncbi:hypothetical protein N7517_008724 [Penicillium concentricum]|uniref:Putative gamma-glutamylcyclotransferase n=1 Tax=Penicillium concentricum TaxID=293559 RepID=A0A9W9RSX2_9EURO|nr:uncharacterized protein N7517_008724 [Penicillium concentricum]KAJ5365838.1 hypothetical protein N7517_008724 [Penicillium concentricum]
MGDHVLFFYGTLMAPQILHKVIYGQANQNRWQDAMLRFQPAILHGYRRHRVQDADYPGIVAVPATQTKADKSSAPKTHAGTSVIGTLVSGLTDGDVYRLDRFEGSEYEKKRVTVRTLREAPGDNKHDGEGVSDESRLREMLDGTSTEADEGGGGFGCDLSGKDMLEDAEWDFESFKRDKMAWWVGADESEW